MENNLNNTPNANRVQIGFFGKTNAGKSSLINALTNQEVSIVSNLKGTTTDPVNKSMELLPLGPVNIIDTAGYNDDSELGKIRLIKTKEVLSKVDIGIVVVDSNIGLDNLDEEFISLLTDKKIPYIIVYNKCDLNKLKNIKENEICVSSLKNININELKNKIASLNVNLLNEKRIIGSKLKKDDVVILVTPIDESAPKGRMILPQVQTIRDVLDSNSICIVVQTSELKTILNLLNKKPKLVITDSQDFDKVKNIVSDDVLLTSFSILFAQYKGILETSVKGASKIKNLKDGDCILISEGCTHHRQCNDIGTVKLPNLIKKFTNKNLNFEFSSGNTFPNDLSKYSLVIHCGGCMISEKEVENRRNIAISQNIPFTNYGIVLSYINGILERSLRIFPNLLNKLGK